MSTDKKEPATPPEADRQVFSPDAEPANADWPKRTPDTSEALGITDQMLGIEPPARGDEPNGSS